ncbi:MAG: hypothetical protein ACXWDO_04260 [Bacteroidia bacterium]
MYNTLLLSAKTLVVSYDEENNIIYMDWLGEQNKASVKNGCEQLVQFLEKLSCHKVLNDNTHVRGSWSEASDWVATECLPNLEAAGMQYLAWVSSPSVYSKLSMEKALMLNKSIIAVTFQDVDSARKWLMSV